jgi:hypothetical protein
MADYYGGHAQAYSIQNQLGQHSADVNELRSNGWKTQSLAFKTLDHQEQDKQDKDLKTDAESDITKVDTVYGVGKAGARAVQGATTVLKYGGTVRQAGAVAGKALGEFGEGSKLFATERFGSEGVTAAKDITGVEGVVAGTLLKGGGETFAKVGAKGFALAGSGLAAYQDIDNLMDTGNMFNTKDAAGNVVKQNLGVDIGNVATIVGGALDVATAFTGGALAPFAAAVNLFAAVDSGISGMEQDKANKATDEKDMKPGAPPTTVAPQAFAQYGILANQAHNPLNHIN